MDYEWLLRPAGAGDESLIWEALFYASHSNDQDGVKPSDVAEDPYLVGYVEGWRLAGCPGVIAEIAGEGVGAAWLRHLGESAHSDPVFVAPDIPELAVAVLPGYQGRGVGTAMVQALLIDVRARYSAVVLSVRAENPAVRLYERLGFRTVDEITNRVGSRSLKMIVEF